MNLVDILLLKEQGKSTRQIKPSFNPFQDFTIQSWQTDWSLDRRACAVNVDGMYLDITPDVAEGIRYAYEKHLEVGPITLCQEKLYGVIRSMQFSRDMYSGVINMKFEFIDCRIEVDAA